MWEKFYKIKKLDKCILLDLHWNMLAVENNTMFIVIYIWRILESPWAVIYSNRDNSVVLSGRMIYSSCISFILRAKQAFRVAAGFYKLGCCDRLWILLRFGKINGNVNLTIITVYCPFLVFLYTITANVITVLAEFIEVIGCLLRIFLISAPEFLLYLCRTRHQTIHKLCIKKISVNDAVFNKVSLYRFIQKCI